MRVVGEFTGVCAQLQTAWKPISQLEQNLHTNSTTQNIHIQVFLYKCVSISLMYKLRGEIACSLHTCIFIFPNYLPELLKLIVALAVDKIFSFSEPSPTLNIVGLFNVLELKGCDTVSL